MSKIDKIRKIIREEVITFLSEKRQKKRKKAEFSPIIRRGFSFFNMNGGDFDDDISNGVDGNSDSGDGGGVDEQISLNEQESSNDIETLNFFDFDGTLMNSPEPEEGKELYAKIMGTVYPYIGWWSKKESLEPFDIKPIQSTVTELENRKNEPNSLTILLTNRIKELEPTVKAILEKNNLYFDDYNFKSQNNEKSDRIKEYIEKYPTVKNINVYDDRDKEIAMFQELKKELESQGIYVNIFHVKK